MATTISAQLNAQGRSFALVISRWNDFITNKLVEGALDAIVRHGGSEDAVDRVYVPGSFEIPLAAQKLAQSGKYAGVICLGCVIRGQTPHFEYVANEVTKGIAQVALNSGVPTTFGIITADTLEQAVDRAGSKHGNKGADAALAAIEMANVLQAIQ